jgi:hypothetical protein
LTQGSVLHGVRDDIDFDGAATCIAFVCSIHGELNPIHHNRSFVGQKWGNLRWRLDHQMP